MYAVFRAPPHRVRAQPPWLPSLVRATQSGTDPFDYPNGELAFSWLPWANGMPVLISQKVYDPGGGVVGDATYAATTATADSFMESIFEGPMTAGNAENFGVAVRLSAHSGTATGYCFELDDGFGGGTFIPELRRVAGDGTFPVIATGSSVSGASSIDGIRITAVGTTIKGYCRISSVWTEVVSVTDATYSTVGYPGFWVQDPALGPDLGITEVSWGTATAGTDATVNAVIGAVAADAPAGTLTADSDVTAAVSDVAVSAPPANNIISVVVNAPAVVTLVSAPAGTVTGGSADVTVNGAPATVTVSAPAATVTASADVTATASDTAVTAPAAALSAGVDVTGAVSDVLVLALRPQISPAPAGGGLVSLTTTFAEDSN